MKNLSKKFLTAILIGGFLAMTGQVSSVDAAKSSAHEINFYGARNLKEVKPPKSFNANPFGLVYENAITENIAGKVNIHPVNYELNGNIIAANIYTPANYDKTKKYPAIVVAHPNGGVKEQVAGLYAQRLAEAGYITITADASFQGGERWAAEKFGSPCLSR